MKTIDYSFFIERYNAGEMNDAEKSWFIKELNGSRELQEEVALRKKTDDILRNKNVLQLRGKLVEIEKKRASNLPCKKRRNHSFKYAAAITGFILLGSIALINVKNFGSDEIYNRYYEAYAIETCTPSRSAAIGTASDIDYQTAVTIIMSVITQTQTCFSAKSLTKILLTWNPECYMAYQIWTE